MSKDIIYRQDVIDAICTWDKFGVDERDRVVRWHEGLEPYVHLRDVVTAISGLPSAEPERKTGEWVGIREYCNYLSSLDGKIYVPSGIGIPMEYCNLCWESAERGTNYCPNCGAKMEVDNNE